MIKLRVKFREEPKEREDVHPTKVLVIEVTVRRLDPAVYRWPALAGSAPAGRDLDLDRRHRRIRYPHPIGLPVATAPGRVLVRGGV